MIYQCSGPRFNALKNPYTGQFMRPKMSVSASGRIRFFAPDTYSTAQSYPTAQDAYRAWNHVDGVEGLKDGQPIVCAYTGKALHLVKDDEGYHYEGGYDPRMLLDRSTFLYFATMRGGESEYPGPESETRVDKVQDARPAKSTAAKYVEEHKAELTEDSLEIAETIMTRHKDVLDKPTVVSMAGSGDKGKGKGKGRK